MKPRLSRFPATRFALFATAAAAALILARDLPAKDRVTLKSGEVLVGEILEKTLDEVTIRYNVTESITDIKTFPRSEVEEIDQEQPDDTAWKDLKDLVPTSDMLTPDDYQSLIDEKLEAFLAQFPTSRYLPRVREMIETLESEKAKAADGSRKIEGKWLSAEDIKNNQYNIEAAAAFRDVQRSIEAGELIKALRRFDELEADYPASKAYPAAVNLVRNRLTEYRAQLKELARTVDARLAERQAIGSRLTGPDKVRAEQAIADEEKRWAALRKREDGEKLKWRSVYAFDKSDIQKALQVASREAERLGKLDTARLASAAEITAKAMESLNAGQYDAAVGLFTRASEAGAEFPVIDTLKAEALRLQEVAATEAAAAAAAAELEAARARVAENAERSTARATSRGESPEGDGGEAAGEADGEDSSGTSAEDAEGSGGRISNQMLMIGGLLVLLLGLGSVVYLQRRRND